MKRLGGLLLAFPLALAAQPGPKPATCDRPDTTAEWYRRQRDWWLLDERRDWSNDSLRVELLAGAAELGPPAAPFPVQYGAEVPESGAGSPSSRVLAIRAALQAMAKRREWPSRAAVGPAGVRAAWLIAQGDSALATAALHRMMESGPGESSPADVAVAEDRLRLARGRKQLYASQLRPEGTGWVPAPTEDPAHVDLRRDAAGLPPLAVALCRAAWIRR